MQQRRSSRVVFVLIGVDFDNTIVCYDAIFHREAVARELIPPDLERRKEAVRDHLRQAGRENEWTLLQGHVYGAAIQDAPPFPGVLEFFTRCREQGIAVRIVSHRTKYPVLGPKYDLHAAAISWLQSHGFFDENCGGLRIERTHFEVSKQDKLARIATLGCTHFIDDLPELLSEPGFPSGVRRILFDPSGNANSHNEIERVDTWSAMTEILERNTVSVASGSNTAQPEPSSAAIAALLSKADMPTTFRCVPASGGANNRTYRIEHGEGTALLKWYFTHRDESRDRLAAEFEFTRFAWSHGIRAVPQPLACDAANRIALYEFLPGRRPTADEIDDRMIDAALGLVRSLNQFREDPAARTISNAAEACFSLQAHLDCVSSRVDRLSTIPETSDVDREAHQFAATQLRSVARDVLAAARQRAGELGISLDAELPQSQRCLSPSDFGYHNAVIAEVGTVRFFDFEYAGWDDPAKLVCDFFNQVEVPVSRRFRELFEATIGKELKSSETLAARVECLFPVYQVKWCCIVLNEFQPTSALRRKFSDGEQQLEERKVRQLLKARDLLSVVQR